MDIVDDKGFEIYIKSQFDKEKIGKLVTKNIRMRFEQSFNEPGPSKITKNINYRIEGDDLIIYSDSLVPLFLEKGTKPHKIKQKDPNKPLAFRASRSVINKDGHKFNAGDWVKTKEVNHPGFEARPFIEKALFLSSKQIENNLFK
jgi:hypothetical protein